MGMQLPSVSGNNGEVAACSSQLQKVTHCPNVTFIIFTAIQRHWGSNTGRSI